MAAKTHTTTSRRILHDLMLLPTAPFAEHFMIDFVERFCERRKGVTLKRDTAGNLLLHVRRGKRRVARPVCITAHLDHPGFVTDRMLNKSSVRAFWRGGVPPEYFVGSRVRFHVDGEWVRGKVRSIKTVTRNGRKRVDTAVLDVRTAIPPRSIGMWNLPEPRIRDDRFHACACDDLAGVAAILACIDRLVRSRPTCDAYFLLTRAEEVGFAGAIAAVRLKTIPRKCFVVAMETSSELPHARMGDGPILRVGDRVSTYTSAVTAHCRRIARELEKTDKGFKYQRKLMDGGMCESSAYCDLGHEATGVCVALGNYHNVDVKRKRIAPEYISLSDYDNVVKWFVRLSCSPTPYTGRDDGLGKQLKDAQRMNQSLLRSSTRGPR